MCDVSRVRAVGWGCGLVPASQTGRACLQGAGVASQVQGGCTPSLLTPSPVNHPRAVHNPPSPAHLSST